MPRTNNRFSLFQRANSVSKRPQCEWRHSLCFHVYITLSWKAEQDKLWLELHTSLTDVSLLKELSVAHLIGTTTAENLIHVFSVFGGGRGTDCSFWINTNEPQRLRGVVVPFIQGLVAVVVGWCCTVPACWQLIFPAHFLARKL